MDSKKSVKNRIDELVELLNYHSRLYYVKNRNEISDYDYDMLQNELKKLEAENPEYVRKDSPTQRVGGEAVSGFDKVNHRVQMGSIQDAFSLDEVRQFVNRWQILNLLLNQKLTGYLFHWNIIMASLKSAQLVGTDL